MVDCKSNLGGRSIYLVRPGGLGDVTIGGNGRARARDILTEHRVAVSTGAGLKRFLRLRTAIVAQQHREMR